MIALRRVSARWAVHSRLAGRNRALAERLLLRGRRALELGFEEFEVGAPDYEELDAALALAALLREDAERFAQLALAQREIARSLYRLGWGQP